MIDFTLFSLLAYILISLALNCLLWWLFFHLVYFIKDLRMYLKHIIHLNLFILFLLSIPFSFIAFWLGKERLTTNMPNSSMEAYTLFSCSVFFAIYLIIFLTLLIKKKFIKINLRNVIYILLMLITEVILLYLMVLVWFFSQPGAN